MSSESRAVRGMPLTQRLSLALFVASFFVAMMVAFLGADRSAKQQRVAEAGGQMAFAKQFGERIAPLLERGDLLRLSMLATAGRDLAKSRIMVLDGSGKVVLDTKLVDGERQLSCLTSGGAFQRLVERNDETVRETLAPVRFGGDPIGEVRLQAVPTLVAKAFDFGLFGLVFLCCLTLVAVAGLMGHHWSARVRRITDSLVQLATGHLTRQHEEKAPAELGQLDEALHELERGVQDGLHRVSEPFVGLALQVVDGLEARGLVPHGHGQRTANYARMLADKVELIPEDRKDLDLACRLQDLGKAWVRPAILQRSEPLTEEEQKSLQGHPQQAAEHLDCLPGLRRAAAIVRHQNERYDGCGGPDRLRGDRIPLGARIRVLAAMFDLLTTCGDGQPLDWQAALESMRQDRGEVYDPWLFDLFAEVMEQQPPKLDDHSAVMILPSGCLPARLDSIDEFEEGFDYDLGQELEVMLDEMPPEEPK